MVVNGTTGQLLRRTKIVGTTAKFNVFSNKYIFDNKTKVNCQSAVVSPRLTPFNCKCRRFHYTGYPQNSRETRTTFTKLSPQEVSLFIFWSLIWLKTSLGLIKAQHNFFTNLKSSLYLPHNQRN